MRKFAVNIIGNIDDPLDKYDAEAINELLDRKAVTDCFKPFTVIGVAVKELPPDGPVIDTKTVKKRAKVKLKR